MNVPIRIGHGYDAHRFTESGSASRPLVLGGVTIPHDKGLEAHSDGDVLIHALCDALLGAIAAGDIGRHFPDTDPAYKNVDSTILLKLVCQTVRDAGWQPGNADITVLAQTPRMAPHVAAIKARLAEITGMAPEAINIKASTTEGMGFVGRREGISVHAVVLVHQ